MLAEQWEPLTLGCFRQLASMIATLGFMIMVKTMLEAFLLIRTEEVRNAGIHGSPCHIIGYARCSVHETFKS